jgi:hypothetical protein
MPLEQIARQHFPGFTVSELQIILIEAQIRMQHQPRKQEGGLLADTQRGSLGSFVGKQPAVKKAAAKHPPFEDLLEMYDEGKQIRRDRGIADDYAPDWTKKRGGG